MYSDSSMLRIVGSWIPLMGWGLSVSFLCLVVIWFPLIVIGYL